MLTLVSWHQCLKVLEDIFDVVMKTLFELSIIPLFRHLYKADHDDTLVVVKILVGFCGWQGGIVGEAHHSQHGNMRLKKSTLVIFFPTPVVACYLIRVIQRLN